MIINLRLILQQVFFFVFFFGAFSKKLEPLSGRGLFSGYANMHQFERHNSFKKCPPKVSKKGEKKAEKAKATATGTEKKKRRFKRKDSYQASIYICTIYLAKDYHFKLKSGNH